MKSLNKILTAQANKKRDALTQSIEQALAWLDVNRSQAPRLNMEADRLAIKLLRQHNHASVLARNTPLNCAIGLFGLAQAGKSYLIGALASSEKGRLECALGNSVVDYASQLNPPQHTANLVQRFSGQQQSSDSNWPVQLSLLTECDLVAVLALQYAQRGSDTVTPLDESQLGERVQNVAMYRQPEPVAGINRHQMVALWDALTISLARSSALDSHFWPQAVELAPQLGVDDRARLFSLLWGEDRQLTALYRQLAHVLHHLSCVPQVLAPLSVLDEPSYSLLNSSGVSQFNATADLTLQVVPRHNGRALAPVSVALAELTLLSREVLLPLYSAPREELFTEVDLLDFPGFIELTVLPDDEHHELALEFLQARRPFLLQRAAIEQDVTHLLVCSASAHRNETRHIGRLLDFWVKQTQGETTAQRTGRKPGLIWAMTPFDQRITHGHNHDAAVQRFVGNPGDAWGAMLAMDEKGVQRMAGYLVNEVRTDSKLARIATQRAEIQRELSENLLGRWYQAAEGEDPAERLRIAESLLKALQTRTGVHGELLERLVPVRDTLRHLFLQRQLRTERTAADEYSINEDDPFGIGMTIDLLSDEPLTAVQTSYHSVPAVDQEAEFAQSVYRHWVNQLRLLPDNGPLLELLGVSKPTLEMLTEELITASVRQELEGSLMRVLADSDAQGLPPEQIADRQVSRALSVLGDFVAWLGFQQLPEAQRPESRINRGQKIFAKPEAQTVNLGPGQRLTRLALKPNNHAAFYIYDWLVGLNEMIVQNAGYAASREISLEQREKLAQILKVIRR
ncbi:virulence factor SrfC family protein [Erwinia rhapontici]|uniref:virulence factor SrfC family protein n=1 Tax=Erwinia rhapontici TaxID=55212 RepID=UPI001D0DAAC2|nr:virulence factor SrfC family protein [Erwinia rhapontici]UDQ82369.1 virulence factor SrfC family protein [Erwinia rhapontici]